MTITDRKRERKEARREAEARQGRLGQQRYRALVIKLAGVIRQTYEAGETGSIWGLEGPLRHAIRADLCLQGWGWETADAVARDVLREAFRAANARRPSWEEGQLEWTIEAGTLIERTRCLHCHGPLPEGHHKYCGSLCNSASWKRIKAIKEANEDRAVRMAIRSG